MIGFVDAVKLFFRRYVDFQGRSSRAEYWWVILFQIIASIILIIPALGSLGVLAETGGQPGAGTLLTFLPLGIFVLAILLPSIALFVRRLHDINQTGWIYLGLVIFSLIPIIGILSSIAQIVIACIPGTVGLNKYGEDPYGRTSDVFN